MSRTITLTTPVEAYGERVAEVTLRAPKGKDIRQCGFPVNGEQEVLPKVVHRYIERLGNLPTAAIDELDAADYAELMAVVLGFFGESRPTSSSGPGTRPTSSASTPSA